MRRLLYSKGSPYARRVRIVLLEKGLPFESDVCEGLRPVDTIKDHNPALQIPVFYDGERRLFESSLIQQYLFATALDAAPPPAGVPPLAPSFVRAERQWDDLQILSVIDSLQDTLVSFLLMAGVDAAAVPYVARQHHRVDSCLAWLERTIGREGFWSGTFSAMDINLACCLLHAERRATLSLRNRRWPVIAAWLDVIRRRPTMVATAVDDKPEL